MNSKGCLSLVLAAILVSACRQSRFPETVRHSENGRVTYTNVYRNEYVRTRIRQPVPAATEGSAPLSGNVTAKENITPLASVAGEYFVIPGSTVFSSSDPGIMVDTIPKKNNFKGALPDTSLEQVIRFKTGKVEAVKIISVSDNMLKYKSAEEKNITRGITTDMVDTVFQVQYRDPGSGKIVDTRKHDSLGVLGFVFSILGLIPAIGLPFAVLGLIFGMHTLKKIRRFPARYKGTKLAKASIGIAIIGLIINVIFIIAMISSAVNSCVSSCSSIRI